MFNICSQCGLYRADKEIDPSGPYAICPECGFKHRFNFLPLLVVSGASGTGKSVLCTYLTGRIQSAVLLDADILWADHFNQPETHYRTFFETWLRLCKNINQSGRPVVLFGAGVGVPDNLEHCIERRYFSSVHYLALVCSDEILAARLRARPAWRGTSDQAFITEQHRFNRWFIEYNQNGSQPPVTLVDTGQGSIKTSARQVSDWIHQNLPEMSAGNS